MENYIPFIEFENVIVIRIIQTCMLENNITVSNKHQTLYVPFDSTTISRDKRKGSLSCMGNVDTDQTAHLRSLISVYVAHLFRI